VLPERSSRSLLKNGSPPTIMAPMPFSGSIANAASISLLLLAVSSAICRPIRGAAACSSPALSAEGGKLGLTRAAMTDPAGATSLSNPNRLVSSSAEKILTPVAFPPGG
jgi:hypothetical protein